jgi:serine/threonine protein kinase
MPDTTWSGFSLCRLQISIGDFDILRRVGEGSFSTVLLARYNGDGRLYALKMINKSLVLRNKVRVDVSKDSSHNENTSDSCSEHLLACTSPDDRALYVRHSALDDSVMRQREPLGVWAVCVRRIMSSTNAEIFVGLVDNFLL